MNATTYKLNTKEPHILGLTLLSAFGAMGAILMEPALPTIARYINVSMGVSQLTVMSMPVFMTFLFGMLHVGAAWILPLILMIALGLMLTVYCVWLRGTSHGEDLR